MKTINFREWTLQFDRDQTVAADAKIAVGSPEDCGCDDCLAWLRHRNTVHPESFLNLLDELGIPKSKEADVTAWEPTTTTGTNRYTGEFVFVGRVISGPEMFIPMQDNRSFSIEYRAITANFEIGFSNQPISFSVASTAFGNDLPTVQLGFATRA